MHNFKQSISHCVQYDDGYKIQYKEWSSFTHNNIVLHSTENVFVIWNDFKSNHKISNQIQIKSLFLNQIIVLQIKSLYVIQSWFKSNHDLDLPTTERAIKRMCVILMKLVLMMHIGLPDTIQQQESLANAKVNAQQHSVVRSHWNAGNAIWRRTMFHVVASQTRKIPREFDLTVVQGHPRSSILVSMESPYVTSY